ncbi:MAG: iron-sulfur cluster repair di-iron protein [Bacteroidetes bacterium]|nr:iron-sulfur cluster repair di-iron protein [Bacteroidota bacterium]
MTITTQQTLASIVTDNYQAATVFEKYKLDFCCKGKKSLEAACTENGISIEEIWEELTNALDKPAHKGTAFADMTAEQLISYILLQHHFYTRQTMPVIEEHLLKVAMKHGDHFPYMKEVLQLFSYLKNEMNIHMQKEEVVLFPRIREMEGLYRYGQKKAFPPAYITAPVAVMENEHDEAGEVMSRINTLTNQYVAPEGACTTFKLVLQELKAFEEDLHKHVHLENHLLFPLAKKIIAEVQLV